MSFLTDFFFFFLQEEEFTVYIIHLSLNVQTKLEKFNASL